MNEILINALVERLKADMDKEGGMTIDNVPLPLKEEVEKKLNPVEEVTE